MSYITISVLIFTVTCLCFGAFLGLIRGRNRSVLRFMLVLASAFVAFFSKDALVNTIMNFKVQGQTIKDMLEMAMMKWPAEDGCFPHLSGISFSVNTSIPSSVLTNEADEFDGVAGEYRVYDIKVYNRETQVYEAINLDEYYTIAAANYYLIDCGSGMTMFKDAEILINDGMLDVEALEYYISEELNGVIGEEYANAEININFTE